jgi:hypothetical protein
MLVQPESFFNVVFTQETKCAAKLATGYPHIVAGLTYQVYLYARWIQAREQRIDRATFTTKMLHHDHTRSRKCRVLKHVRYACEYTECSGINMIDNSLLSHFKASLQHE